MLDSFLDGFNCSGNTDVDHVALSAKVPMHKPLFQLTNYNLKNTVTTLTLDLGHLDQFNDPS